MRPSSHLARGGWSAQGARIRRAYRSLEVTHQAEQAPHHDNRVLLGRTRDAFGMRRVSVDWRWHDEDVAATMRAQEVYASELERAGVGRFAIARQDGGPVVHSSSTGHFMGTTRMSTGARDGVVDARCRVHGAENLLVVSTSVFPTGGFANPTLTLVALALRVADELRGGVAPAAAAAPAPATVDGDAAPRRARPARRPRPRRVRGRVRG
jgi:choline dehydrogenase-like flavoprotein